MATSFVQWWNSHSRDPKPKPILWVCGPARVLVDDVVAATVRALDTRPWSIHRVTLGEHSEDEVWALAQMVPLETEDRVILVHNAERLQQHHRIAEFTANKRRNPRTHLIFVSGANTVPKVKDESTNRMRPAAWLDPIRKAGKVIECKPFTNTSNKYAVAWIRTRGGDHVTENLAKRMVIRANGDLRLIRDACVKLAALPGPLSNQHVDAYVPYLPDDSFVDALMLREKKTALAALALMTEQEKERALYELANQIQFVGTIHDMVKDRMTDSAIRAAAQEVGKVHLVGPALRIQSFYTPKRRLDIKRLLETVSRAHDDGAREGVLESIVAVW